nr:Ycf35 protein [Pyropia sp. Myanmar_B]
MSHFTKIQTTIQDSNLLKYTLTDLGLTWYVNSNYIQVDKNSKQKVDILIKQNNLSHIGFMWNDDRYHLVADLQLWEQPWSIEVFLDKLSQKYAYYSIIQETKKQGFENMEQISQKDGSIRLVMQRWKS